MKEGRRAQLVSAKNNFVKQLLPGGTFQKERKKCIKISDTQIAFLRRFTNPYAGLSGQGANIHIHNVTNIQLTLMDELEVSADLVPGEYILSFIGGMIPKILTSQSSSSFHIICQFRETDMNQTGLNDIK